MPEPDGERHEEHHRRAVWCNATASCSGARSRSSSLASELAPLLAAGVLWRDARSS